MTVSPTLSRQTIDIYKLQFESTLDTYQTDFEDELDTYPFSQPEDDLRVRYNKVRRIRGNCQTILAQVAGMIERISLILCWCDRRATALFLLICFIAGVVNILLRLASSYVYSRYNYYVTPSQVIQALVAVYLMRPPRFRSQGLPRFINFLLRFPSIDNEFLL